MFDLFKQKSKNNSSEADEIREGEKNAEQLGRDIAKEFGFKLDIVSEVQFAKFRAHLVEAVNSGVLMAVSQLETSPLLYIREVNAEAIRTLELEKQKIVDAIYADLADFDKIITALGLDAGMNKKAIESYYSSFQARMIAEIVESIGQKVDMIEKYDEDWRTNYPELAAQQPLLKGDAVDY